MRRAGCAYGRLFGLAAISGACFFAAARISHMVAVQPDGMVALWAADAVLLAVMLAVRDGRKAAAACTGAVVASVGRAVLDGQPIVLAAIDACAHVLEVLFALLILSRFRAAPGPIARVRDVMVLLLACLLAPISSAMVGALGHWAITGAPIVKNFLRWYISAALGLAVLTPAVVSVMEVAQAALRRSFDARRAVEGALVLGLVAVMAIYVFFLAHQPTTFLLMPVMLLAAFRLRQFGAVAAAGIVALVAATATAHGVGPLAVAKLSPSGQLIYLQVFLAATFFTALPVAAARAEHDARADDSYVLADHFKAVVENVDDAIFRIDRAGRWTYLNPAWEALSGYPVATSIGRSWADNIDPSEHAEVAEWAAPIFSGDVLSTRRLLRFHTAAGAVRWMELSIQGLTGKTGEVVGATGTLRDVHDRKRLEEQVMTAKRLAEERERAATLLAATDELTGLPNRRAFLTQLDRMVATAADDGGRLAVAIFDVDHFKVVNDTHGHAVGDQVLQRVAARAAAVVRGGDIVGRIGGEEFGILMPGATLNDAAVVAERLRLAMRCTAEGPDDLPTVTVSVGISAVCDGQTGPTLLAEADAALYEAKGDGRNRIRIAA